MRWAVFLLTLLVGAKAEAGDYRFVSLEFAPLIFTDDRGQPAGAAVEIVTETMRRLGHSVDIKVMPWSRALGLVRQGKADAIFTAYKNREREVFLDYMKEILVPQVISLYVKKGSPRKYTGDINELKGMTIGTLNTISYGEKFDTAKDKLKLRTERVETLEENFRKLAAGRLDYVISNRYSGELTVETLKLMRDVVELPKAVEMTPSFVAFSKKRKLVPLRDAFDREIVEMRRSGRYQAILDKYRVRAPAIETLTESQSR